MLAQSGGSEKRRENSAQHKGCVYNITVYIHTHEENSRRRNLFKEVMLSR